MAISKACKPENFESHNSLKISFTNIRDLRSNFVDVNLSLNQTRPTFLLYARQTWITQLNLAISHVHSTHVHGLAVYVKEGLPFARNLYLENSADSYLCFRLALLHSVSYFFFLYRSPSSSLCTVFNSFSSNIDEVR